MSTDSLRLFFIPHTERLQVLSSCLPADLDPIRICSTLVRASERIKPSLICVQLAQRVTTLFQLFEQLDEQ